MEFLLHKNSLRSKNAHSREVGDVARRLHSARECAKHILFMAFYELHVGIGCSIIRNDTQKSESINYEVIG